MKLRTVIWTIRRNWKNKSVVVIILVCTMVLYTLSFLHENNSQKNPSHQDYVLSFPSYDDLIDPSIHEANEMGTLLKKRLESKRQRTFKKEFDYFGSYEVEHWSPPPVKAVPQVGVYPGLADKVKITGRELTAHIEDTKIKQKFNKQSMKSSIQTKDRDIYKNLKNNKSDIRKSRDKNKGKSKLFKSLEKPNQDNIEVNTSHQFKTYISDYKGVLGLHQEDPRAIDFAKKNLHKPSTLQYNITGVLNGLDSRYLSASQEYIGEAVQKLFNFRNHTIWGTFFEAGAYDGEFLSNTLWMEMEHGWHGLLVEPNPESFGNLLKKHRKASAINCCLSTTPYITTMTINLHVVNDQERLNEAKEELLMEKANQDPTDHFWKSSSRKQHMNATKVGFHEVPQEVLCLPLYTLLSAANLTALHFMSLDVEYVEMGVLRSLPWDKLDIQVLAIEHLTEEDLQTFMEERGYYFYSRQGEDWIFVSKKYITIK